jgi:hypothetical protein
MNLKLRYSIIIIDLSLKNPKIQELPGALPPWSLPPRRFNSVYSSGVLSLMKNDKMSKRKKAITDYFMQSKKLNKGEDSMKTCQIMLFG